jgi:hypothetical protein
MQRDAEVVMLSQTFLELVMNVKKVTPLLFVEEIEPCLEFWEKVGFTRGPEVPHGDKLGFVILQSGDVELMYQTRASVAEDVPPLADSPMRGTFIFIEVNDLDAIEKALSGVTPVVPRRKTFYGSEELIVKEPAGNIVTFAQFTGQ